jgi:hypothetical protein
VNLFDKGMTKYNVLNKVYNAVIASILAGAILEGVKM